MKEKFYNKVKTNKMKVKVTRNNSTKVKRKVLTKIVLKKFHEKPFEPICNNLLKCFLLFLKFSFIHIPYVLIPSLFSTFSLNKLCRMLLCIFLLCKDLTSYCVLLSI